MILERRRRSFRALALAALASLGVSSPGALAAEAGADITGTVLFDDGVTPARGVSVRLRHRDSGQEYASRSSDATGRYEIHGVPDGEYVLAVSTSGGEFILPNRVVIAGGQPSAITLILTPAASQGASARGDRRARGGGKAAILIPTIGGILVAAFAADQLFEKDEDASPKLP